MELLVALLTGRGLLNRCMTMTSTVELLNSSTERKRYVKVFCTLSGCQGMLEELGANFYAITLDLTASTHE